MSDRGLVFIVDHDAGDADTLRELLEQDGYVVEWAACGADAVAAVTSAESNLVLLDAHLCDANPFELLAELRQSAQARDIPVIFMTTREDAETWVKGLESGDDLIVKPFDKREVLARIERQVTVSKVRMALRQSEQALRESTAALRRKNEELQKTLNRLNEAHDQLIIQEKMASLGKLSAGMAHELHNPAAAAPARRRPAAGDFLEAEFEARQHLLLRPAADRFQSR